MTKTPKVLVGITAGLALLVGPTAVYADKIKEKGKGNQKVRAKINNSRDNSVRVRDNSRNTVTGNTSCSAKASGLVAIPVNACDVLDLEINDSLNNLLKNLLAGGLL